MSFCRWPKTNELRTLLCYTEIIFPLSDVLYLINNTLAC